MIACASTCGHTPSASLHDALLCGLAVDDHLLCDACAAQRKVERAAVESQRLEDERQRRRAEAPGRLARALGLRVDDLPDVLMDLLADRIADVTMAMAKEVRS